MREFYRKHSLPKIIDKFSFENTMIKVLKDPFDTHTNKLCTFL